MWSSLLKLQHLTELDLVTMKLENIRSLLEVVGERLLRLTVECDEEQGTGSEIVHIARSADMFPTSVHYKLIFLVISETVPTSHH